MGILSKRKWKKNIWKVIQKVQWMKTFPNEWVYESNIYACDVDSNHEFSHFILVLTFNSSIENRWLRKISFKLKLYYSLFLLLIDFESCRLHWFTMVRSHFGIWSHKTFFRCINRNNTNNHNPIGKYLNK